jgi:hypothetical protein
MSYDAWKTTDPRDSEPDWDGVQNMRDELDDLDRAMLDEAKFWQDVNNLSIEFPDLAIVVIGEDDVCPF